MSDGIKKVAERVRNNAPQPKVTKANHMLRLREPLFGQFRDYCRSKGMHASEVVDQLIEEFMAEVRGDLGPSSDEPDSP